MPALARMNSHEKWVAKNATSYSACLFVGSGKFNKVVTSTLDEARTAARAMETDRPVLIYAIFRNHQAQIETVDPRYSSDYNLNGENGMTPFNLINLTLTPFVIRGFQTVEELDRAAENSADADNLSLRSEADLVALQPEQVTALYNYLAPRTKKAPTQADLWSMLTTGAAAVDDAPETGAETIGNEPATGATVGRGTNKDAKAAKASDKLAKKAAEDAQAKAEAKAKKLVAREEKKLAAKVAKVAKDAKKAAAKVPKSYMTTWPAKPMRTGTSLARILTSMLAGGKTLEQITKDSGVTSDTVDPSVNVLHRIRHVLHVNHGIRHEVSAEGIYTAHLPEGYTAGKPTEGQTSIWLAPAPAKEKPAKATKAAKVAKVKPAKKGKKAAAPVDETTVQEPTVEQQPKGAAAE